MPCGSSGSRSSAPRPMLPPTAQAAPAVFRIWPISAVVVDLPLVPVTPTKRLSGWARASSSTSQISGFPAARAASATGCGLGRRLGMPGLITSAVMFFQSIVAGSANLAPSVAACSRATGLLSHATHSIPAAIRARTVVRPERASPSTTYDEPLRTERSIIRSPQFQGGQADHREDGGDDPEAKDDGRLGPPL